MTALIVIAVIAVVFAFILLLPIRFRVFFKYNDNGIQSDISLKYGVLTVFPRGKKTGGNTRKDGSGKTKEKPSYLKMLPGFFMKNRQDVKTFITSVTKRLLSKTLKVDRLYINAVLGFSDAMDTGLIYGAVSGTVYNIAGLMDRRMRLKKHDITLKPDFNEPHIFAETEVIISTNGLNTALLAVTALVRAVPLYKKLKEMIGENDNGKSD